MTVVLWDINVFKRRNNYQENHDSPHDWGLQDYYSAAQRCIGAFASSSLAHSMLRDEDAVSFVAEHMMYAAHRWHHERGRTLHSYLNQCALWSIKRWIKLCKTANCAAIISLHDTHIDDRKPLYAITAVDVDAPDAQLNAQDLHNELSAAIDSANLTSKQSRCIESVYVQGLKPAEVARNLGITRQAVHQCLEKGVAKIKAVMNNDG
jgi:RNA polymerase sigma factor (sigma-70 family)